MPPRPFGNVPELLSRLAAEKLSPQTAILEQQFRTQKDKQFRSDILTQFLSSADLTQFKQSDLLGIIGTITNDPDVVAKAAETRFTEGIFQQNVERLQNLGQGISEGDTPRELAGDFIESGGDPKQIPQISRAAFPTASIGLGPRERFKVVLDEKGNPVTQQFGSGIRIKEVKVDLDGRPILDQGGKKQFRFAAGGNISVASLTERQKDDLVKRFEKSSAFTKAQERIGAADNIVNALNSNNPIADSAIATLMSRASGEVGNLSEADKRPFGGSKKLLERISQVRKFWLEGKLTDNNRRFLRQLSETFRNSAQAEISRVAKDRAGRFVRRHGTREFSEEEILFILDDSFTKSGILQQQGVGIESNTIKEGGIRAKLKELGHIP